ncbi:heme ABC transporter ATP-binding protein [Salinispirillum sp. LH 10-3-1]|uniref:Heme ABC transporter ATP-binding protein n=1 Tax=Salinispirillum sp. LH 10-3-1 TaxID=2952525 RepID=A0AB38YEC4_9GAMM
MASHLLTVDQLCFQRGGRPLLDHIDLTLSAGEAVALVGMNGAGKSTLLRCITGEWAQASGRVLVKERELTRYPSADRAQWLGVLPQSSPLNFPFEVHEVIALGRYPHRTGIQRDRAILAAAADACDVTHLLGKPYTACSGGEQQRIQLARVLAQIWEPVDGRERILLLDEPVSGLDLAHQHALFRQMAPLQQQGVGVIFVVHDLNLAARYADRIALLDEGRLICTDTPAAVLTEARVREHFHLDVDIIPHPTLGCPTLISR